MVQCEERNCASFNHRDEKAFGMPLSGKAFGANIDAKQPGGMKETVQALIIGMPMFIGVGTDMIATMRIVYFFLRS